MDLTIEELAARQIADYRRLTPGTFFGEQREPLTLEEAYRAQEEVSRLRVRNGERVAGYKVGCTSAEIERLFGLRGPIYAVLFENELRKSGERLDASTFANLAIEGEMAARIGEDGAIAAVFPVIELHNLVFRSNPKTLAELVVNNGLNAGVVLPDEITNLEAMNREHRRACGSWSTGNPSKKARCGVCLAEHGRRSIGSGSIQATRGQLAAGATPPDRNAAWNPSRSSRRPCRGLSRRLLRSLFYPMSAPRRQGETARRP